MEIGFREKKLDKGCQRERCNSHRILGWIAQVKYCTPKCPYIHTSVVQPIGVLKHLGSEKREGLKKLKDKYWLENISLNRT